MVNHDDWMMILGHLHFLGIKIRSNQFHVILVKIGLGRFGIPSIIKPVVKAGSSNV
jgi:hypothetical protein